jgi:3-phenylpropionate/cinnamic acid dioxygenase small subunit
MIGGALREEVEGFLVREAELLDERRFEEWLSLFSEDAVYEMSMRVTQEEGDEFSKLKLFDETVDMLRHRINRLRTRSAWAERPPSRTRHFLTNLRIQPGERPDEIYVRCHVLVIRNRGTSVEGDIFTAVREDVLRRVEDGWKIVRRRVIPDQSVLAGDHLSFFF